MLWSWLACAEPPCPNERVVPGGACCPPGTFWDRGRVHCENVPPARDPAPAPSGRIGLQLTEVTGTDQPQIFRAALDSELGHFDACVAGLTGNAAIKTRVGSNGRAVWAKAVGGNLPPLAAGCLARTITEVPFPRGPAGSFVDATVAFTVSVRRP